MVLGVQRGDQRLEVPVVPALSADGSGRIGVQLTSNFRFTHSRLATPSEGVRIATVQLARCFGVVLGGGCLLNRRS